MTKQRTKNWYILGAGAIGSLWASHLTLRNIPTRLILRDQQRLNSFTSQVHITGQTPDATINLTGELAGERDPIQRLLVTTKSYDTLKAITSVQPRLSNNCLIVLLQNGMGQQQLIADRLPEIAVYAATTTEGVFKQQPNQLFHAGRGETWIGPINDAARQRGSDDLEDLLRLDLTTGYDINIERRLWQKLAINAAINGLTAKYGCKNGALVSNPAYRDEVQQLCQEVEAVARALNQPLFERPLIDQTLQVATATASNYSSMLQDLRNGRHTEIDFINGYICQQAIPLGIDVSSNQALIETILNLQ
jgi:2-dehydropantoate 2-reductase